MSYFGSSRAFYDNKIFGSGFSEWVNEPYDQKILNMSIAKSYYTIALGSAKTPEQKAKCYYMLSKCERNEWYNAGKGPKEGTDFIAWQNFRFLKQYANTAYYKEVLKECGYFKVFAGS